MDNLTGIRQNGFCISAFLVQSVCRHHMLYTVCFIQTIVAPVAMATGKMCKRRPPKKGCVTKVYLW